MKLALALLCYLPLIAAAESNQYLGRDVCAGCHKDVVAAQRTTAMAQTWQGSDTARLPENYRAQKSEGPPPPIEYRVYRDQHRFRYDVTLPGHVPSSFNVETVMGGARHGFSFLLRVPDIDGFPLPRAPLVEGRYLHYAPDNQLLLSPGFPHQQPSNWETAIGRPLSLQFEQKCLNCHGQPRMHGTSAEAGVSCESCHGPGGNHLAAISHNSDDKAIANPAKWPVAQQMQPCSQCHSGFSAVEDPLPADLLISNQVNALKNSECWRQTAGQITCTNCHDPHRDRPQNSVVAASEKTCRQCHSARVVQHAAICPVNQDNGCVGCHMPEQKKDSFRMADHWIRVHPEQQAPASPHNPAWQTRISPRHLYLRILVTNDRTKASDLQRKLIEGSAFFETARDNSMDDTTAPAGGYLGDVEAREMDPGWANAALALASGQISPVIESSGKYVILQRLPRNFRQSADAHFQTAMALRNTGNREQSAAELLEALKIYPRFLRALTWLGVTFGETGNATRGVAVLRFATQLYPQDAGAHFNLGIAYGSAGKTDQEISEYKRALDIEPDLVSAYLNLGAILYAEQRYDESVQIYHEGINANPLIASLHYSLSIVLQQQGKTEEAQKEMELASKIDPNVSASRSPH